MAYSALGSEHYPVFYGLFYSRLVYCTDLVELIEAKDMIGDTVFTNILGVDDGKGIMKVCYFR